MGFFGVVKDLVLLPVDIVLDVTGITPVSRIVSDADTETPFGTVDRLESLSENLEETRD